jgi:hypothetical protein
MSAKTNRGTIRIDPKSSPGHPWCKFRPTNGDCFGYKPYLGYEPHQCAELRHQVIQRLIALETGAILYPIYVFIKPEPHKPAKAAEGRWRLIAGVSVVDRIAHQLYQEPLSTYFCDNYFTHDTAAGWSVMMNSGLQHFNKVYPAGEEWDCADKSAWDWTVQGWVYLLLAEFVSSFYDFSPFIQNLVSNMIKSVGGIGFTRKMDLGSGFVNLDTEGVQLSGNYLTLLGNSFMQHIVHYYADVHEQAPVPLAQGDDTLQRPCSKEYWAEMLKAGLILKTVDRVTVPEFCGMTYSLNRFDPVYEDKHNFMLYNCKDEVLAATIQSYQWLYMFNDEKLAALQLWLRLLEEEERVVRKERMRSKVLGVVDCFGAHN